MKTILIIKTIIIVVFVAVMTCVVMSSCSATRSGCPDTHGLVGYR
jgi:hypothetical protein